MDGYVGQTRYLYRNTGTYASPTWDLIGNVRNLQITDEKGEAVIVRRLINVEQQEPTLRKLSFSWEMLEDTADTDYTTLRTAYVAGTLVEFAFADGPIATSGTHHLRCETKLFSFSKSEPNDDGVYSSIVAKPCVSANAPVYTIVA